MSTDWDSDNPFAPEEKTAEDFFNRSSKYVVSSTQVAEPAPKPAPAPVVDWERPRPVLPSTAAPAGEAPATSSVTEPNSPAPEQAPPITAPSTSTADPGGTRTAAPTEELYLDPDGLPTLFDVAIAGDRCRAESLFLPRRETPPRAAPAAAGPPPEQIEARVRQALDEAMPELTRRTLQLLRESLNERLHQALRQPSSSGD